MYSSNLFAAIMVSLVLFVFSSNSEKNSWNVVDDEVMGGKSSSEFFINNEGNGIFKGNVSLENNGGFSSIQHVLKSVSLDGKTIFKIRLKGDGKKYQFRVKSKRSDYYSYIYEFQTKTEWETTEIPISEMKASFRGRKLDIPNYDAKTLEEMAFLISNKKVESFELLLDKIEVK